MTKVKPLLIAGAFFLLVYPVSIDHFKPINYSSVECMTANVYFEARNQSLKGMKAVAAVTHNRVKSKLYPKTICEVVFERKQFSWTHLEEWNKVEKILNGKVSDLNPKDRQKYMKAKVVASIPSKSLKISLPSDTLWYHSVDVKPSWSLKLNKVTKIDSHIFYKR